MGALLLATLVANPVNAQTVDIKASESVRFELNWKVGES
jgi:hypothetical protein